jgi:E3 ubiquitin-protein ligase Mdm2
MAGKEQMDLRASLADPKPQTLAEINRSILNSYYTFKLGSPLKKYILKKTSYNRESYTLAEILTILKVIIRDAEMFDLRNPAIILCDNDLERVLNMRALHVTEIRNIVYCQLMRLPEKYQQALQQQQQQKILPNPSLPPTHLNQSLPVSQPPKTLPTILLSPPATECELKTSGKTTRDAFPALFPDNKINPSIYSDINARFELKQDFRTLLSSLPNFKSNQKLFAYAEITKFLSLYILSKKELFFDARNIKVALIKDDPLSKVFQVDSFHRCQVTNLLRRQIIYVGAHSESSHNSQGPNIIQVPALDFKISPPASVGAENVTPVASVSAENSTNAPTRQRKRSCSDNEQPTKRFRPLAALMLEIVQSCKSTEVEALENCQAIFSESDEESEYDPEYSDSPVKYTEESYSEDESAVEYDMDSTEEQNYRPPQAGGGNNKSSDEDSELECQKTPIQVEESDGESLNWADNEDNIPIVKQKTPIENKSTQKTPIENKSIASVSCATPATFPFLIGYQKCLGCKDILTKNPYCHSCWKMKKDWLPDRPKPRSKKTSRRKRTEQRDKRIKSDTLNGSNQIEDNNPIATKASVITSLCMLCCTNPRDASLIHGQIGHQLCCYPCAKKLWKEQARCPVCRRKVEKIVKLIQN